MVRLASPLKWHGGKYYLAKKIISMMPPHTHYVEPYAGGLQVLWAKSPELIEGHSEVVNDIHGELTNFWSVLGDERDFAQFHRTLECVPFSQSEWQASRLRSESRVERAIRFFVRYRQSRQALGKDFATLTKNRTRRGMNEQASAWLNVVDNLPECHERMRRVVVLNKDALEVIRSEDGPNTFFYLDPPYVRSTRKSPNAYEHELADNEEEDLAAHEKLLQLLSQIKSRFLLSSYSNELYNSFTKQYKWTTQTVQIDKKSSGSKTKEVIKELLITNY